MTSSRKNVEELFALVLAGKAGDVARMLAVTPDIVDAVGVTQIPALRQAALQADVEVMRVLLDAGANIDLVTGVRNKYPVPGTALLAACSNSLHEKYPAKRKEAIMFLLERGAKWTLDEEHGRTTAAHRLMYSALTNRGPWWDDMLSTVLTKMFERGLDPNSPDESGFGLLHVSVRVPTRIEVVDRILGNGANIHMGANKGEQPLHMAASLSSASMLRALADRGAAVSALDNDGRTPLFYANEDNACHALLALDSKIDHTDKFGRTALMHSINELETDYVKPSILTLLEAGASTQIRDENGETAADIAARRGFHVALAAINARAARSAVQQVLSRGKVKSIPR